MNNKIQDHKSICSPKYTPLNNRKILQSSNSQSPGISAPLRLISIKSPDSPLTRSQKKASAKKAASTESKAKPAKKAVVKKAAAKKAPAKKVAAKKPAPKKAAPKKAAKKAKR